VFGDLFTKKGGLPDFMIIGAPKCGTTSLFQYLGAHPLIENPRRKEIHYFDENYHRGDAWYRRRFPFVEKPMLTGEATTAYLYAKDAPARAHALVPNAKLIVVLRDPVKRVISHYWHNQTRGRIKVDFDTYFREALSDNYRNAKDQAESFIRYPVQWGFYKEQVERWLRHYPRKQFLFLRFRDFTNDAPVQINKVFEFLGVDPVAVPTGKVFNASEPYEMEKGPIIDRLYELYARKNAGLDQLIGPQFKWDPPSRASGYELRV
jgi:Sulfotransferase domain